MNFTRLYFLGIFTTTVSSTFTLENRAFLCGNVSETFQRVELKFHIYYISFSLILSDIINLGKIRRTKAAVYFNMQIVYECRGIYFIKFIFYNDVIMGGRSWVMFM